MITSTYTPPVPLARRPLVDANKPVIGGQGYSILPQRRQEVLDELRNNGSSNTRNHKASMSHSKPLSFKNQNLPDHCDEILCRLRNARIAMGNMHFRILDHRTWNKFGWSGRIRIIDKTLLGTYCLQDPNGRQLATLVHGNHLIDAKINNSIEKLEKLWASPRLKDMLRRENLKITYVPASPENTDILEQHMQEQVDIDEPALSPSTTGNPRDTKRNAANQDKHPSDNVQKPYDPVIRISLKRLREVEALDELLQPTKRVRPNTT